jgi:HD superfamily phosphohydrolase
MPLLEYEHTISDPIYGSIPLTQLELEIIDTAAFQRLRHVRQLGMADYVFPSADYSRFAHSIGACHTIGQILEILEPKREVKKLTKEEIQFRRVAMLLHDIGHYFMSHAAEYAIEQYDSEVRSKINQQSVQLEPPKKPDFYDHEQLGGQILLHDPELSELLSRNNIDPDRLGHMFEGALDEQYGNLVSSELDADRLDYLMRSSQATGLPYGHFDRDYLIQNMLYINKRVCLKSKAIRAADHFVMCRSFDYLQVIFHKTIVGFEEMLKHCIKYLLSTQKLILTQPRVLELIKSQEWLTYDDPYLLNLIKEIPQDDPVTYAISQRIIKRKRAELLWADEELVPSNKEESKLRWHREIGHCFEDGPAWTKNCKYWFKHFKPTEATPFGTSYKRGQKDEEAKEKSIHILRSKDKPPQPLTECRESFTRHMSNQAYVMVRIYYVGPETERESTGVELQKFVKKIRHDVGLRF